MGKRTNTGPDGINLIGCYRCCCFCHFVNSQIRVVAAMRPLLLLQFAGYLHFVPYFRPSARHHDGSIMIATGNRLRLWSSCYSVRPHCHLCCNHVDSMYGDAQAHITCYLFRLHSITISDRKLHNCRQSRYLQLQSGAECDNVVRHNNKR